MYPYNRNTQLYRSHSLTTRETRDPSLTELAEDSRLLALLLTAV